MSIGDRVMDSQIPGMPLNLPLDGRSDAATALAAMLDCYSRALMTAPANTLAHAIIEGAFGKVPEMAAKILKGKA